ILLLDKTSTNFSNVELVPRTHRLDTDEQVLLTPESYHQRIVESFSLVFKPIEQARNRALVGVTEYQSVKDMANYVLRTIEGSGSLFNGFGNFSLLHGDVHAENIIKIPEGMRLIDFENMHYGDRATEIAYFLEHCSQAGFIRQANVSTLVDHYLKLLTENCHDVVDRNFKDRLKVLRAYLTVKLLGMLSNGYTASNQGGINRTLFEDVLSRSRIVLASL
ncbi:phosphotransferase, partial [Patescibacteria group bacterium]|nr:phosphotransferase [Patescibacteria group bacterium]